MTDTPTKFCADFADVLDRRGASLRHAATLSGWGKSTIAAARRGPDLPNVQLVVDVLAAIGESEATQLVWRARHDKLVNGHSVDSPSVPAEEALLAAPGQLSDGAAIPDSDLRAKQYRRPIRLQWLVSGAVLVVIAVVMIWSLVPRLGAGAERTIVVQNKVAFGPSGLKEDVSPSYLAARPIARCANVPACKLLGTDMASGDTVDAICQLQAVLVTNANISSAGIKENPNAAASSLWYGVRWRDGRRGYISEVYVAPMYRGGLQLPPC